MSRILVDQVRSNSASSDALTLDGSGNITVPGNLVVTGNANCNGTPTGFGVGGKILQIVQASHTSQVSSTNTSYIDTGLNVDITTGSAASKIYVVANVFVGARASNGGDAYMRCKLLRDSTDLRKMFSGGWMGNLSSISYWQHYNVVTMPYLDAGVSTGTTYNYKVQVAMDASSIQVQANPHTGTNNGGSWITAMEVAT